MFNLRAAAVDLSLAGFSGAPAAMVIAQTAAQEGSVSFTATEVAVVTAMLGCVVAGLALVFRLLLVSKDATVASVQAQNAALTERLQRQYQQPVDLLSGALRSNEAALMRVSDCLQRCTDQLRELTDVMKAEHAQFWSAIQAMQRSDRTGSSAPAQGTSRRRAGSASQEQKGVAA